MTVDVRPARPEEADALVPLYDWLFAPPGSPVPAWDGGRAAAALAAVIDAPGSDVLVAESDGELVGLCSVYADIRSVRFGPRVWVEDLAVHPDRRSLGIGKRLLDAAKTWARDHGATHLELDSAESRVDAHRFYEREGADRRSLCFGWEL